MRTNLFNRLTTRPRLAAAVAALALVPVQHAAAEGAPSLARTISYEDADIVPARSGDQGTATSLSTALYAAPLGADGAAAVDPAACSSCGGGSGGSSGGGSYYNRCGCSAQFFPWFQGPGNCDDWCVGPHWEVALDAMILSRDTIDWSRIAPGAGFAPTLQDQFNQAPGARVFVTGYNENRFGVQVGYEGANDFHANSLYTNGPDDRAITYESRINSVEVNVIRRTDIAWRPFVGVRYVELDEDFVDFTTVDRPVPPPAANPLPVAFIDSGRSLLLDNRMVGLQGGAFRDVWRWNRWVTLEPFGNAGVYLNDFRRREVNRTVTTVVTGDDIDTSGSEFFSTTNEVRTETTQEFSELAFIGEAGVTAIIRLNRCLALRGGYQVLVVNGAGTGIDAFLAQGLNSDTLTYHGGHFGLEYVR